MKKFTRTLYRISYNIKAYNPTTDTIEEITVDSYSAKLNEEPEFDLEDRKVLKAEVVGTHVVKLEVGFNQFVKFALENGVVHELGKIAQEFV